MSNKSRNQIFTVRAHWNVATHPSLDTTLAVGSYAPNEGSIFLPEGAIIIDAFYNVSTTFTDGGDDNTTIALGITGATGAITAATAISAGGNVWDAANAGVSTLLAPSTTLSEATPNTRTQAVAGSDRTSEFIHMDADKELLLTTAVDVLSAGSLDLWVSYVVSRKIA